MGFLAKAPSSRGGAGIWISFHFLSVLVYPWGHVWGEESEGSGWCYGVELDIKRSYLKLQFFFNVQNSKM